MREAHEVCPRCANRIKCYPYLEHVTEEYVKQEKKDCPVPIGVEPHKICPQCLNREICYPLLRNAMADYIEELSKKPIHNEISEAETQVRNCIENLKENSDDFLEDYSKSWLKIKNYTKDLEKFVELYDETLAAVEIRGNCKDAWYKKYKAMYAEDENLFIG
ncbi:MAG: hypothetical protein FWE37_06015 [Spirochaetaceae bacterium]|nr:hypothetical protein [Spirochaetaceae bacterium]